MVDTARTGAVSWHDAEHPKGVDQIEAAIEAKLNTETIKRLLEDGRDKRALRARFEVIDDRYIFGVIPIPHVLPKEDKVVYHETDVILTDKVFVTVRKEHASGTAFDPQILRESLRVGDGSSTGDMFYRLMEDVALSYVTLMNGLQDEINELEQVIEQSAAGAEHRDITDWIHRRHSSLRRDLVEARRQVMPLVAAIKAIDDERLDVRDQIFPDATEALMRNIREDLDRVVDTIPLVSDLLSGVRDYHQGVISQRQNDVMQKLTVIASLLLVPTLIVGVYGQNFASIPETHWRLGYAWSWILIVFTTLIQLLIFRQLGWLGRRTPKVERSTDIGSVLKDADED